MLSVTRRIDTISQPKNGYVPKKLFVERQYDDGKEVSDVKAAFSSIQGMAVDYLTRFMLSNDKISSFDMSIRGAKAVDEFYKNNNEYTHIMSLLNDVNGLDDTSIFNTCQIVGYDVVLRQGVEAYEEVSDICPNSDIIENIRIMVNRGLAFLKNVGPVILDGFVFEGGYTDLVSSGDGDYLTKNMLIDFKVSKKSFSSKWSLQLLMYYLLGIHSIHVEFRDIELLCVFNPYENKSYTVKINDISDESKYKVSNDVLGYKMQFDCRCFDKNYNEYYDYSHWKQVAGSDKNVFKKFLTDNMKTDFNINDYSDGIHSITIDDYWTYMRSIDSKYKFQLRPIFKHTDHIIMIKRNGYLMFISVSHKGKLCILRGAGLRKATFSPQYYYDNIECYAEAILSRFSKYWDTLYSISDQLKRLIPDKEVLYAKYMPLCKVLGITVPQFDSWYEERCKNIRLSGRVHGCIVDIDNLNHIYLNPYDGKVIPYFAQTMYDKNVYKNTLSLISEKRPEMLKSLRQITYKDTTSLLVASSEDRHELVNNDDVVDTNFVKVYEHDMYDISNKLEPLQNIYDKKLVQVWYDEILNDNKLLADDKYLNKKNNVAKTTETKSSIKSKYMGMTRMMNCGLEATVIDYIDCKNMTIQFADGLIKSHVRSHHFMNGNVSHTS